MVSAEQSLETSQKRNHAAIRLYFYAFSGVVTLMTSSSFGTSADASFGLQKCQKNSYVAWGLVASVTQAP